MTQQRTCENCAGPFTVPRPSDPRRFCSRRCGTQSCARGRVGPLNSNWRGGKHSHPLYDIYNDMLGRCHRPTHLRYADYGGRGITVCDRWRADFWAFVADMGDRPAGVVTDGRAAFSIDRRDNDAGYSRENCRWADGVTQANNKRGFGLEGRERDPITGRWLPGQVAS